MSDAYDAGLLNDWGGGNIEWWQDYIRAELERSHEFYAARIADLERQLAEAREVKTMEWTRNSAGDLASGPYVIEQVLYTFYVRWGETHIYPGHETLEAAMAHANQHRKADILSALKGTP